LAECIKPSLGGVSFDYVTYNQKPEPEPIAVFKVEIAGTKPFAFEASGLPDGLIVLKDPLSGEYRLSGTLRKAGKFVAPFTLSNACGSQTGNVNMTIPESVVVPEQVAKEPEVTAAPTPIFIESGLGFNITESKDGIEFNEPVTIIRGSADGRYLFIGTNGGRRSQEEGKYFQSKRPSNFQSQYELFPNFFIFDVSDFGSPRFLGSFELGTYHRFDPWRDIYYAQPVLSIVSRGSYIYVGTGGSRSYSGGTPPGPTHEFYIIDISAPTTPRIASSLEVRDVQIESVEITLVGNYAYLSGGDIASPLKVADIRNPSSPSIVKSISTNNIKTDLGPLIRAGNYGYITARAAVNAYPDWVARRTNIVNISNPPSLSGIKRTSASLSAMAVLGDKLYGVQSGVLSVFDISDPTLLSPLASPLAGKPVSALYTDSGLLYAQGTNGALFIVDGETGRVLSTLEVSTFPLPPSRFGNYDGATADAFPKTVYAQGNHAYIGGIMPGSSNKTGLLKFMEVSGLTGQ